MKEKMSKAKTPLKIQDMTLRDGHQSNLATRMRTEDMIPIAEKMDDIGFWSMEVWGGATLIPCTGFWQKTHGRDPKH
jgi:pyruvate/oxaloacetate carboxyltransferase